MLVWILFGIAGLLLTYRPREHLVVAAGPGVRPSITDAAWRSKVDAQAPIGGSDDEYILALQSFYDTVYKPARDANSTAEIPAAAVEAFLTAYPVVSVDKKALRQILLSGFAIDRGSAEGREEDQLVTTGALKGFKAKGGSEFIEPKDGVLETWKRTEDSYVPADPRLSTLPEGIYEPLPESAAPRHEGQFPNISASWTGARPYTLSQNVR
jgi:hypothetical protein